MTIRIYYDGDSSVIAEVLEGEEDESTTIELESEPEISSMAESALDSSVVSDSSAVIDSSSSDSVAVLPPASESASSHRPFMDTPLDDYNVTEGLLLLLLVFAAVGVLVAAFRGR